MKMAYNNTRQVRTLRVLDVKTRRFLRTCALRYGCLAS